MVAPSLDYPLNRPAFATGQVCYPLNIFYLFRLAPQFQWNWVFFISNPLKPFSMNRKLPFILLLSICCLAAYAQPHDLVASSGGSFKHSSGYLSYSIGELFTSTLSSSSAILTQGFHQTRLRSGVPVISSPAQQILVYPNPVQDVLTIQLEKPAGFDYLMYDLRGRLLERGKILDLRTEIDVTALEPAVYLLRVTDNEEERMFQIVKF